VKDIQKHAEQSGFSWATLRRAKGTLGISAQKSSFRGVWEWNLPEDAQPLPNEEAQPQRAEVSAFGDTRINRGGNASQSPEDAQPAQLSNLGSEDSDLPLTEVEI
jgi:hypothetical protein